MKVTILGSGTGIPSLQRNAAGYLLEVGGLECLIDCGSGTLLRLERVQKSQRTLDAGKVAGHLSAGECGRVAAGAGVAKVVLTHFERLLRELICSVM